MFHLPGRTIASGPVTGRVVTVVVSARRAPVRVRASDFTLAVDGDMLAVRRWNGGRSRVVPAHRSHSFRLTFDLPATSGALYYRPGDGTASVVIPLGGRKGHARRRGHARASAESMGLKTFPLAPGVGEPWGTAVDRAGNIWFAEPGCDFAPTCAANTPPGQIGKLVPATGAVSYYTLPAIPGNQPIFVNFDDAGNLWFTTPNNDMIGEFSPATGSFVGQWGVTPGTGPWDLKFAGGRLWYSEHLASAIGVFDPAGHSHTDYPTPTPNSNPYGVAPSGGRVWFTENNSSVARIGVLDIASSHVSEYPIFQPTSGTPHLIVVDASGHPWWTEGWSNSIATLDPAVAVPGDCQTASGPCRGVQRFTLPASSTCGNGTHTSGIAIDGAGRVWISNSLSGQVGSFTPSTASFDLTTLSNCGAHPHDGVNVDLAGNVWFDEEFANALGELIPAAPAPLSAATPAPVSNPVPPSPPAPAASAPVPGNPPASKKAPRIRGRAWQGQTLIARKGSWTGNAGSFAYTWQRCAKTCTSIRRASGRSYRVRARDVDARVRVIVTARNHAGSARRASRSIGPVGPSRGRIRASLARVVTGSPRLRFVAPSRGRFALSWWTGGLHVGGTSHWFRKAGDTVVTIHLSARGRRLLDSPARFVLTSRASFRPVVEPAVTRLRRLRLTAPAPELVPSPDPAPRHA